MSVRLLLPVVISLPVRLLVTLSLALSVVVVAGDPHRIEQTFTYDKTQHVYDRADQTPAPLRVVGEDLTDRGRRLATLAPGLPAKAEEARIAAKGGLTWAEQSGILRAAARGRGNFGVGSATAREADDLGRAWVGEGYTVASDGKTLVSQSGLRQYRPPSYKPKRGSYQANFEQRFEGQRSNRWQGNAHLDITDLP